MLANICIKHQGKTSTPDNGKAFVEKTKSNKNGHFIIV